jgi:uncharacterized protein YjiS (DUF1127 family)
MFLRTASTSPRFTSAGRDSLVARLLGRLLLWQARAQERRILASLDDRLLKDIGLDRGQVMAEADKPFWRA